MILQDKKNLSSFSNLKNKKKLDDFMRETHWFHFVKEEISNGKSISYDSNTLNINADKDNSNHKLKIEDNL